MRRRRSGSGSLAHASKTGTRQPRDCCADANVSLKDLRRTELGPIVEREEHRAQRIRAMFSAQRHPVDGFVETVVLQQQLGQIERGPRIIGAVRERRSQLGFRLRLAPGGREDQRESYRCLGETRLDSQRVSQLFFRTRAIPAGCEELGQVEPDSRMIGGNPNSLTIGRSGFIETLQPAERVAGVHVHARVIGRNAAGFLVTREGGGRIIAILERVSLVQQPIGLWLRTPCSCWLGLPRPKSREISAAIVSTQCREIFSTRRLTTASAR